MKTSKTPTERFLSVFIVVSIVLLLICGTVVACVLYSNHMDAVKEAEEAARKHYLEHNHTVSYFPYRMKIGDKFAKLSGVDFFELYGNHSYNGYVIITIDRYNLSDDDVYWILKGNRYEWELDATAYWWPDGTDGETDSIPLLGCRYDENNIYFIFRTDPQRRSLKGCKFSVAVTYLQDGADYNDQYHYSYIADFSDSNYHNSTDYLPVETLKILADVMIDAAS